MINYKNKKTKYRLTAKEVAEMACKLIIFCNMNPQSGKAQTLKNQLCELEGALEIGNF